MERYYLVIALFCVAAAADILADKKEQCLCEEKSTLSLTVYKEGVSGCGLLSLNGCKVTITCQSNFSLTLDSDKSVDLDCLDNTTTDLLMSDKSSVQIILQCSEETAASLDEESNVPVLRISQVCSNNSNGTSLTTTSSVPTDTTEKGTTKSNNNATTESPVTSSSANSSTEVPSNSSTEVPSNSSTVSPDHSSYSNATGTSNSSYTTTEGTPSGNSTQELTTTTQHAVSFKICSGLLVLTLAVNSLL